MVVFTDGLPDKGQYKKFRIKQGDEPNDFAMMQEVLSRRLAPKHRDWKQPDLILIDGGKGQLSAAQKILDQYELDIPIASLAKQEELLYTYESPTNNNEVLSHVSEVREKSEQQTKVRKSVRRGSSAGIDEEIRRVRKRQPHEIRLPYDSPALYLIQRMRDEAHRFTITYHRLLRSKKQKRSILDEIPSIGPKTKKQLLNHFGSLKAIRAASDKELAAVIGSAKTKHLRDYL